MRKLSPSVIRRALAEIGRQGGAAGKGKSKRRGGRAYYAAIRRRRKTYPDAYK